MDHCFREVAVGERPIAEDAPDATSSLARTLTDLLRDGHMRTDGTETVDGRELIRVIEDAAPDTVWYVDPDTYRPVRVAGDGGPDEPDHVTTIEYLPRDAEGLAAFTPAVPAGYRQVDELTRTTSSADCL